MTVARVFLLLASCLVLGACGEESAPEDDRPEPAVEAPNIVFVLLDDATKAQYTAETMPFTWRYMRRNATTFTDYIVTSPLCCPSRATLITGQYGHNNGVLSNSYSDLEDPGNVLPAWLQEAGYRTAHVGKFLNNYEKALDDPASPTPGWDEWFTELEPQGYYDYAISDNGTVEEYGTSDRDYLTRVLSEHATGLIAELAPDETPFYLAFEPFAPHTGGGRGGECDGAAVPDPRDEGRFENAKVPASEAIGEVDSSDKPSFMKRLPRRTPSREAKADGRYRCALASLRGADRAIEKIVGALEEEGVLGETAIIFSSDNGLFYGEHGIPGEKQFPYREAYEVPLQIALPNPPAKKQPDLVDLPVANIDVAPTVLELVGGEPCPAEGACRVLDGRSLLPLLLDDAEARDWKGRARGIELNLPANNEPYDRVCEYYGVRAGRWVYVQHMTAARSGAECEPVSDEELYDLRKDPGQLDNASGELPAVETRLRRLARRIRTCEGVSAVGKTTNPCDQ